MQQRDNLDVQLNWVPFRYKYHSQSKRKKVTPFNKRVNYSKTKKESNPQKLCTSYLNKELDDNRRKVIQSQINKAFNLKYYQQIENLKKKHVQKVLNEHKNVQEQFMRNWQNRYQNTKNNDEAYCHPNVVKGKPSGLNSNQIEISNRHLEHQQIQSLNSYSQAIDDESNSDHKLSLDYLNFNEKEIKQMNDLIMQEEKKPLCQTIVKAVQQAQRSQSIEVKQINSQFQAEGGVGVCKNRVGYHQQKMMRNLVIQTYQNSIIHSPNQSHDQLNLITMEQHKSRLHQKSSFNQNTKVFNAIKKLSQFRKKQLTGECLQERINTTSKLNLKICQIQQQILKDKDKKTKQYYKADNLPFINTTQSIDNGIFNKSKVQQKMNQKVQKQQPFKFEERSIKFRQPIQLPKTEKNRSKMMGYKSPQQANIKETIQSSYYQRYQNKNSKLLAKNNKQHSVKYCFKSPTKIQSKLSHPSSINIDNTISYHFPNEGLSRYNKQAISLSHERQISSQSYLAHQNYELMPKHKQSKYGKKHENQKQSYYNLSNYQNKGKQILTNPSQISFQINPPPQVIQPQPQPLTPTPTSTPTLILIQSIVSQIQKNHFIKEQEHQNIPTFSLINQQKFSQFKQGQVIIQQSNSQIEQIFKESLKQSNIIELDAQQFDQKQVNEPINQSQKEKRPQQLDELNNQSYDNFVQMISHSQHLKELSSLMIKEKESIHLDESELKQQLRQIIGENESIQSEHSPNQPNLQLSYNSIDSGFNYFNFNLQQALLENNQILYNSKQEHRNESNVYDQSNLKQINEDSNVNLNSLPARQLNLFEEQLTYGDDHIIELEKERKDSSQISQSTQKAQIDKNSVRQFKSHFHPRERAMKKIKRDKQNNSADCRQNSLKSIRVNQSLSAMKCDYSGLEPVTLKKNRNQKNLGRFNTRFIKQ